MYDYITVYFIKEDKDYEPSILDCYFDLESCLEIANFVSQKEDKAVEIHIAFYKQYTDDMRLATVSPEGVTYDPKS